MHARRRRCLPPPRPPPDLRAVRVAGVRTRSSAVADVRAPGDLVSPVWRGMIGPALPFYGIHITTLLQTLPAWLAGPLGVLPLFGWLAVGGRLGIFASLWFAGFIAAVAIFARPENVYWMGLFIPAYGVGLAFAPRALVDLVGAIRRPVSERPRPALPR